MTRRDLILGVVIVLLAGFIGWEQYNKAVANAVAMETAKILAKAQQEKDAELAERDRQYQQDTKAMQEKYDNLKKLSPQKIVEKVPEYIPLATHPVVIWEPGMAPPNPGDAVVPQEDIRPIAQTILDGQKCKLDLTKCAGDLIDWKAKYDLKDKESAKWEQAAKGGSWAKRLGKDALKVGIGVGIGFLIKH